MSYAQGEMKGLNRRAVFDLIADVGCLSRADIASALDISMPTVLKITSFFMEKGFLTMSGEECTARGRRPQLMRFEPDKILGIGVSYDGHVAYASVLNYWGGEIAVRKWNACNHFDLFMQTELPQMLHLFLEENNIDTKRLYGIGVAVPGSVNSDESRIEFGPLSGIRITDPPAKSVETLAQKMSLAVYLFNDVNSAAVGEYVLRRLHNDDLVFLQAGEGIGAGIILNGQLRTGRHFYTGEIAHLVFDPRFTTDINQPGWFESQLSLQHLREKFHLEEGDAVPDDMLEYVAQQLALAVANICNLLDVDRVVLGGDLMDRTNDQLIARVRACVKRLALFDISIASPSRRHPVLPGTSFMAISREMDQILSDKGQE